VKNAHSLMILSSPSQCNRDWPLIVAARQLLLLVPAHGRGTAIQLWLEFIRPLLSHSGRSERSARCSSSPRLGVRLTSTNGWISARRPSVCIHLRQRGKFPQKVQMWMFCLQSLRFLRLRVVPSFSVAFDGAMSSRASPCCAMTWRRSFSRASADSPNAVAE